MIVYKDFKDFEVCCFPDCADLASAMVLSTVGQVFIGQGLFVVIYSDRIFCIAREVIIERLHAKRPCPYFATICKPDISVDITIDFEIGGETRCAIQG